MLFPAEQGLKPPLAWVYQTKYYSLNAISSRTRIETIVNNAHVEINENSQCYFQQNKD